MRQQGEVKGHIPDTRKVSGFWHAQGLKAGNCARSGMFERCNDMAQDCKD